ncbi:hypothetical protein NECAME_00748 [Necator americanus]|uniref:Uncharacterized protein n=1 Tax=Necator americanus TaxID=51031 RepID=W2SVI6_NECAM|nr:hypothetical protein NECAME_00748 [Necator americanus]ETN73660.1 hypothetical protein NECAME_00748 [Necator americanus]
MNIRRFFVFESLAIDLKKGMRSAEKFFSFNKRQHLINTCHNFNNELECRTQIVQPEKKREDKEKLTKYKSWSAGYYC